VDRYIQRHIITIHTSTYDMLHYYTHATCTQRHTAYAHTYNIIIMTYKYQVCTLEKCTNNDGRSACLKLVEIKKSKLR